MNMLGLSTQIQLNIVYLTDSSPRSIKLRRKITLQRAGPKSFLAKGKISSMAMQASLKSIGKKNVTSEDIEKNKKTKKEQVKNIIHNSQISPVWISNIMLNKSL